MMWFFIVYYVLSVAVILHHMWKTEDLSIGLILVAVTFAWMAAPMLFFLEYVPKLAGKFEDLMDVVIIKQRKK